MPATGECYLRRVEDLVARIRESSQVKKLLRQDLAPTQAGEGEAGQATIA